MNNDFEQIYYCLLPTTEWRDNAPGYTTSKENKIGERLGEPDKELTLFSQGSAYSCGQSVIFRVVENVSRPGPVEADQPTAEEGLALTVADEVGSLLRTGAIFVSADGKNFLYIYIYISM